MGIFMYLLGKLKLIVLKEIFNFTNKESKIIINTFNFHNLRIYT